MNNLLLSISPETVMLLLSYGACALIIVISLIIIILLKNHTKKQLRAESVKKACEKAKKYAEKLLSKQKEVRFLAATNLMRLNGYVTDAAWLASQIAEVKKDIVFEKIAGSLDEISTKISNDSENGYVPQDEYIKDLKDVLDSLTNVISKIENIISNR